MSSDAAGVAIRGLELIAAPRVSGPRNIFSSRSVVFLVFGIDRQEAERDGEKEGSELTS